jgi:transketolase
MGDQIGLTVSGMLKYVPLKEFKRVLGLEVPAYKKAELFAALCRINTLYMIACAGSGHIGSSFSSMDIMSWLELYELRRPSGDARVESSDIFFSSKGHDAPALYSTWIGNGRLDFDLIHKLRRLNGLPGHPDIATPNVVTNTGSLGMGVSKAKGMIIAKRLLKQKVNVYVLTGDGELQEGQFWESLISAANNKMHELTVIIDHNKLQSDTLVSRVSDLGDLEAKLSAFGWHVDRCNGNDMKNLAEALARSRKCINKPKVIIADTIKGKGVSFMEHTSVDSDIEYYKYHSGAPSAESYTKASQELIQTANTLLTDLGFQPVNLEFITRPNVVATHNPEKLIAAYSESLLEQASHNEKIVALDADLILDTGLIPFQREFPNRFIECGIAEQDMVSQAGGMALQGLLPIVHSFTCFLSTRPNEQIYNNATENKKIIYVGSLAGVIPGGPGHSHQGVRDISALAAIPGLTLLEPSCEAEVKLLLEWAINSNPSSSYLRLVSLPYMPFCQLPENYIPQCGKGVVLHEGNGIAVIAYGPIILSTVMRIAEKVKHNEGVSIKVINLPWLNTVNANWLKEVLFDCSVLLSIDNHYSIGGQFERISEIIAKNRDWNIAVHHLGITEIPVGGNNKEILEHYMLDEDSLEKFVGNIIANNNLPIGNAGKMC